MADFEVWTVGHSNRSAADFVTLITAHGIQTLVDIRRFPRSRQFPHFNRDELSALLARHGVAYVHLAGLGGYREVAAADSPNRAWPVDAFNAYADHMQSAEFLDALRALWRLTRQGRVACMCAEAAPEQCHRQVLSDGIVAKGGQVQHILAADSVVPHVPPAFARFVDQQVTYPGRVLF